MVDKFTQWTRNTKVLFGAAWKEATWVFVLSRVVILILTYIGAARFPANGYAQKIDCSLNMNHCLMSWRYWDVGNFTAVALHGYADSHLTAFFPLWPFMIRLFGDLFRRTFTVDYIGAILLSNACFFVAMVMLYKVVSEDFESSIAKMTLFLLAFSPLGLFFFSGYSESLFLLLLVLLFYCLQRAVRGSGISWWLAGLCGLGAALTRATGIVLLVPYVVVLVQHYWQLWRSSWEKKIYWKQLLNASLPMLLIPAGLVSYMLYLGITKGNPLLFSIEERTNWYRYLDWPWFGIASAVWYLFKPAQLSAENMLDLLFTCVPIIALIISWKRLPLHYTLLAAAMLLITLMSPLHVPSDTLTSEPRYLLVIFPFTVIFALWSKQPRIEKLLFVFSLTAFVLNLLLFVTGRWAG